MDNKINIPKIRVNAEFQRLLWLNGSWGIMIGIVLLYSLFVYLGSDKVRDENQYAYLAFIGSTGISLSGIFFYTLIQRSLKKDVDSNSFDQLRMSSLSAWQMTYSRLLVAPAAAWLVFVLGWLLQSVFVFKSSSSNYDIKLLWLISPFSAWSFACMILANAMQFKRGNNQWEGSLQQLILLGTTVSVFLVSVNLNEENFELLYKQPWGSLATKFLISSISTAVFAGIAAHAAMAHRLHLHPARPVFLILGLLSPVLLFAQINGFQGMLWAIAISYGAVSLISLATQNNSQYGFQTAKKYWDEGNMRLALFNLPAWTVLLPLGLLSAAAFSSKMAVSYTQIIIFMGCVLIFSNTKPRYNAITIALAVYLILRWFWTLFKVGL